MVVRDTAIERECSFACHFLHILFFFSQGKIFSLSCSSPPTECLKLEEKKDNKGQKQKIKKSKNQKRKKGEKEEKKFLKNYKRGTSLEFQPFQFIFFLMR